MPFNSILFQLEGGVARVTLNRPEAGNLLDAGVAAELKEACARIEEDDAARVAVIRGSGTAFCAGGAPGLPSGSLEPVAALSKPVICEINGDALGVGLELALACDLRIAADRARFALGQVAAGGIPQNGGTQRLPRIVGRGAALQMLLTANGIDALEAVRVGLVARTVPISDLEAEVQRLALKMAEMAPYSLKFAKEAVGKGMDLTLTQGLRLEADLYFLMHTTRDRVEGITSYLQKKAPHFEGR